MDMTPTTEEERALLESAHALQRAAGKVLKHAGGGESMPTLAITLAHVEEALDRLSVGMLQLDLAVTSGDDRPPPAEVRALSFHLRMVAERLRESEHACQSSRMWTRRAAHAAAVTA